MQQSLTKALLGAKCPKCRQGNMFTYPGSNIAKFNVMNKECPHCHVMLEPEPGFYQGAMYVGYAFTVAVTITVALIVLFFEIASMWTPVILVSAIMILIIPVNYRYSRVFYLYMFGGIKFDSTIP